MLFSRWLFLRKSSAIDILQSSKYAKYFDKTKVTLTLKRQPA